MNGLCCRRLGVWHVEDCGDSACRCSAGLCGHVGLMCKTWIAEMHMGVNTSGNDVLSGKVAYLSLRILLQEHVKSEVVIFAVCPPYGRNSVAVDQYGSFADLSGSNKCSVFQESHFCAGLIFLHLSFMTPQNASPKIPLLILDVPSVLSTNMIGTSLILKPSL